MGRAIKFIYKTLIINEMALVIRGPVRFDTAHWCRM